MTGEVISHYEVLDELGRGGMGVVYRARDTKLDRYVALKFLPQYLTQDASARRRFVREAKAAASIEHNHICTIHDIAETDDGRTYIVMALYSGQALNQRLADGRLERRDVLRIAGQTASALAAAHESGIIHRDIKPGNLLLTSEGDVKLVDFGLAKLAGHVELTREGSTVGTAAYMSPEQIRGEEVDARTDLWSLGVVLYEMIAGQRPFRGEYEQAVAYSILNEVPPPFDDAGDELSSLILDHLLVKDRNDRISSAPELVSRLDALKGNDTASVGTVIRPESRRWSVKRRAFLFLGIVLVTLLAIRILSDSRPPLERVDVGNGVTRVAVLPFSVRGGDRASGLGQSMVDLLSTKIDGAGTWHSVDPRWIFSTVTDENEQAGIDLRSAQRYALELSASLFVLGNVVEVGDQLRVDASLYHTQGASEPIGTGTVEGKADDLFLLIDDLAAQILVNPGSAAPQRLSELAVLTTNSLEALKAYLDGESAFRAFNFVTAANSLQHAVEIDSTFALAWYRLSVVADWIAWAALAQKAAREAVRFGDGVSDRDKYLFEAIRANRTGDIQSSERIYNEILLRDPNDSEALFNLAELLYHDATRYGRPWTAAREVWERLLSQEPSSIPALVHLARIALYLGEKEKAGVLVDLVLERVPEGDRNHEFLAYRAILTGEQHDAEEVLVGLEQLDSSTLILTTVTLASAELDYRWQLRVLDECTRPGRSPETRVYGYLRKSQLHLAYGNLKAAREELDEADRIDHAMTLVYRVLTELHPMVPKDRDALQRLQTEVYDWNAEEAPRTDNPISNFSVYNGLYPVLKTYLQGRLAIELGDDETAIRLADELESGSATEALPNPIRRELAASLRTRMITDDPALQLAGWEDAFPRAWYQIRVGSPVYAGAYDLYERALVLESVGRFADAIRVIESTRRMGPPEFAYYVPGLLVQARCLSALGRTEEARAKLERFEALWQDAGPEFEQFRREAHTLLARL